MIIEINVIKTKYVRKSKTGIDHEYFRKKTVVTLRCDNCLELFERDKGSMDPKRLNNNYYHVCSTCDGHKFAQSKGVERRNIWNIPASSLARITKF
jgi:hypothetical protein